MLVHKNLWSKEFFGQKIIGPKKSSVQNNLGSKKFWDQKIKFEKSLGPKKHFG